MAGDKRVTGAGADTDVAFKNCAPFLKCRIIFISQCLCIISLGTVIFIQTHHEVCGSVREIKCLQITII